MFGKLKINCKMFLFKKEIQTFLFKYYDDKYKTVWGELMSRPKEYFRGDELEKAIDWYKRYEDRAKWDVDAEIEGTWTESGEPVILRGEIIDARKGFLKKKKLTIKLDKKPRWLAESIIHIGKPGSKKKHADVAAEDIFLHVAEISKRTKRKRKTYYIYRGDTVIRRRRRKRR